MIISSHSMAQLMRNENDSKSRPYEILYFVSYFCAKKFEQKNFKLEDNRKAEKLNEFIICVVAGFESRAIYKTGQRIHQHRNE